MEREVADDIQSRDQKRHDTAKTYVTRRGSFTSDYFQLEL